MATMPPLLMALWSDQYLMESLLTRHITGREDAVVKLLKSRWWNATFLPLPYPPFPSLILSPPFPFPLTSR